MNQEIYVIDNNEIFTTKLKKLFKKNSNLQFKHVNNKEIDEALRNIPELIIINEDTLEDDAKTICDRIRSNEDNAITPIIVISANREKDHKIEVLKSSVEHYIHTPVDEDYFYHTVINLINLLNMNRRMSPLTGLPGNVQIQAEMKKQLLTNQQFAMIYIDLDNFKAYNDIYGFVQGDEIIKFTARVISKNVHKNDCENSFIGHIGGDDFIVILKDGDYEKVCQDIIIDFDNEVPKYFNEIDKERGYMEVANRKGIIEQFPLTSISIGVVVVEKGRFKNTLEIGEVGAQVKHLAKTTQGSTYVINRRK